MSRIRMQNGMRRERLAREMSQVELAAILGIDNTTLSKWEKGHPVPDEFKVRAARFFGLSVYELFYFDTVREVAS